MYETQQLDAVASRLKSYQEQIMALSHALDALRDLADSLVQEIALDSATISACAAATHGDPVPAPRIAEESGKTGDDHLPLAFAETIELDASAGRLDGTEIVVSTADAPLPAATQAALDQVSQLVIAEKAGVPAGSETMGQDDEDKPAATRNRVLDFASRLKTAKATPFRQKAAGAVASVMLMVSATVGVHGFLQTDIGQRLLELGTCDAVAISENRDCAFLGWLLL